jgi:hypothetical protein
MSGIGKEIRQGGATPPAASRHQQRPREVLKQLLETMWSVAYLFLFLSES